MKLEEMTRDEKSLLLFLETRVVDYWGKVDTRHMNDEDMEIARRWSKEGFIEFGRIAFKDVSKRGTHWCRLSEKAWRLVHQERRIRAERGWLARPWKTAEEARNS